MSLNMAMTESTMEWLNGLSVVLGDALEMIRMNEAFVEMSV